MVHIEDIKVSTTAAKPGDVVEVKAKICRDLVEKITGVKCQVIASASNGEMGWTEEEMGSYIVTFYPLQIQECTDYIPFKFTMPARGDVTFCISVFTYDFFGNLNITAADRKCIKVVNESEGVVNGETVTERESIITAKVVDINNKPIKGATVTVNGTTKKTDETGIAKFVLPYDKQYRIVSEYQGYTEGKTIYLSAAPVSVTLKIPVDTRNILDYLNQTYFGIPLWGWISIAIVGAAVIIKKPEEFKEIKELLKLKLMKELAKEEEKNR